jgi:hypothetical protein
LGDTRQRLFRRTVQPNAPAIHFTDATTASIRNLHEPAMFRDSDPTPFLLAPRDETKSESLDWFWAAVDETPIDAIDRPIAPISVTPRRDRDAVPADR